MCRLPDGCEKKKGACSGFVICREFVPQRRYRVLRTIYHPPAASPAHRLAGRGSPTPHNAHRRASGVCKKTNHGPPAAQRNRRVPMGALWPMPTETVCESTAPLAFASPAPRTMPRMEVNPPRFRPGRAWVSQVASHTSQPLAVTLSSLGAF